LEYLDVVLAESTREGVRIEDARVAIGRLVEEMGRRGEAHAKRDWRQPAAYRDTVVSCLRVLMRWGFIEQQALPDSEAGFLAAREHLVMTTDQGRRLAEASTTARREEFGRRLVRDFPVFRDLLLLLRHADLLVPETTDSSAGMAFPNGPTGPGLDDGARKLAVSALDAVQRARDVSGARMSFLPGIDTAAADLVRGLGRRFAERQPRNRKELTGAANKALAGTFLRAAGLNADWNAYDRSLRWARGLYVANDARHVAGVDAWVAWATATTDSTLSSFVRRGITQCRDEVERRIIDAYGRVAKEKPGMSRYAPVPIYEVRETAAYLARVSDEVVDRVLADMAFLPRPGADTMVSLLLGGMRPFAPSARPFRHEDRTYYYVAIHPPSAPLVATDPTRRGP